MNGFEWFTLAVAAVIQALYLRLRKFPLLSIAIIITATLPACWLAVDSTTRIATCDDSYIIYEIINLRTDDANQLERWQGGAFRTTTAILGPAITIAESAGLTKDLLAALAKMLFCLIGLLLLSVITEQTHFLYSRSSSRALFYIIAFNTATLLPVVNLALHTLNYDLLSMEMSVLALIWLGAGLRSKKSPPLIGSLVAVALAAQEKLIASPLLWLCMFMVTLRFTLSARRDGVSRLISSVKAAAVSLCVPMMVFILSHFIVTLARHGNPPENNIFMAIIFPFIIALWPILRYLTGPDAANAAAMGIVSKSSMESFLYIFISGIFMLPVCSFIVSKVIEKYRVYFSSIAESDRIYVAFQWIRFIFLTIVILTGVWATFFLDVRVTPQVGGASGEYIPKFTVNGVALFFGAHTITGHLAASIAWFCAIFVNAIPSIVLGAILLAWALRAFSRKVAKQSEHGLIPEIISLAALCIPVIYGLIQMPSNPRYLNLFLLVFCLMGGLDISVITIRSKLVRNILACVCIALLIAEVLPFRPALVTFRPIWSNPPIELKSRPEFGHVFPWCTGWGEEVMLAGKRIYSSFSGGCGSKDDIHLLFNYSGSWMKRPENMKLSFMDIGFDDYTYNSCDFYIFTRTGTAFYGIPFPSRVKPLFTVENRGVVKAWVFRGSDLKSAGIEFSKRIF